jgi:hypothetical protein
MPSHRSFAITRWCTLAGDHWCILDAAFAAGQSILDASTNSSRNVVQRGLLVSDTTRAWAIASWYRRGKGG